MEQIKVDCRINGTEFNFKPHVNSKSNPLFCPLTRHNKSRSLNSSVLAEFFYVNIFYDCLMKFILSYSGYNHKYKSIGNIHSVKNLLYGQ